MSDTDATIFNKRPKASALSVNWGLDPSVVFLNHGSFGATPLAVLAHQATFRELMESEPVAFWVCKAEPLLDAARAEMAAFVGCEADDFAFVTNATTGVNTVLRSLVWQSGDEVVTSAHEYNACNNVLRYLEERCGIKPVLAEVPFPVEAGGGAGVGEEAVVAAIVSKMTARTRLVMVSHVTSPSGMIMPVKRIAAECAKQGVDLLVDGAHAPGFVDLDVESIGCAYYTGNFHKWVCAPKGSGFLYVRKDRQALVEPLVISHGRNLVRQDRSRFRLQFDYTGTQDISAYMATPHALRLVPTLAGCSGGDVRANWAAVRDRNHGLAMAARAVLCERLGVNGPVPESMLGSLVALALPLQSEAREAELAARPAV